MWTTHVKHMNIRYDQRTEGNSISVIYYIRPAPPKSCNPLIHMLVLNKFSLFTKATFTVFSACVDLVLYYWTTSAFIDFCHCVVLVMLTLWCFISIQSTKCISVIWRPVFVFFVVIGCCELTGVIIPTLAQWNRKYGKDCHQDLNCAVDS